MRPAKEWNTYEISVGPELCDLLGPSHPATVAKPEAVEASEQRVGLASHLPALECIELAAPA